MIKKFFAILLCLALLCCVPCSIQADVTLDHVSVTIPFPQAGQTPPNYGVCGSQGYKIYAMDWHDWNTDKYLEPGQTIQAGHSYEVQIWVEADSGYEFKATNDSTPAVTASVNGEAVEVTKAYEYKAWAMVVLTYYISPVPAKGWVTRVDIPIPEPVAGQEAYYGKISTPTFYTGNVYFSGNTDPNMENGLKWYRTSDHEDLSPNGDHTFDPNTAYTFQCLVFPQEGYHLTPNAAVTVNGKWARSMLDYDTFLSVTYDFPATGEVQAAPHTHTPSAWRTTGAYHYKACTTCGDFLDQEDHTGGRATCAYEGECSVCGYPYLPRTQEHTPSAWRTTGAYHYKACTTCGDFLEQEDHIPGPGPTQTEPQKCKTCGYILQPAINHTHTLHPVAQVEPTCTLEGVKAHYACDGCPELFADAQGKTVVESTALYIPKLGHTQPESWSWDDQLHWQLCKVCSQEIGETKKAHTLEKGKCTLCGYDAGSTQTTPPTEATQPIEATQPTQTTGAPQETKPAAPQEQKQQNNLTWLVVVIVVIVAGGAGFGVTWFLKKKT